MSRKAKEEIFEVYLFTLRVYAHAQVHPQAHTGA